MGLPRLPAELFLMLPELLVVETVSSCLRASHFFAACLALVAEVSANDAVDAEDQRTVDLVGETIGFVFAETCPGLDFGRESENWCLSLWTIRSSSCSLFLYFSLPDIYDSRFTQQSLRSGPYLSAERTSL